jgi:PAS domain S-box-containing protein
MVTAYASLETAMRALNEGAYAYITKPLNMDQVLATVRETLEKQRLVMENRRLYQEVQQELAQRKAAQEALEAEHRFISAVLDTVGALVVVLDRRGRIVRFNKACEQTTGYSFDEVKNKHVWDLFVIPDEIEPVKALFGQMRAGQFPNKFENYWLTRDGGRLLISWSNTALTDDEGVVKYVIATGVDITERKWAENALRESEEKFRKIISSARDAIIMTNDRGSISFWNDRAERLFGYSAQEVIGKELYALLAPKRHKKRFREGFDRFKITEESASDGLTLELVGLKKDGREFPIELALSSTKIHGAWHAVGFLRDITKSKELQEALVSNTKNLETAYRELLSKHQEFSSLARELETARKEWEATK